ncbi:cytochrome c peroxidase [uncultured Shewanella sp.]|uniref:cytochrome-c peroxidase n=1 Tax=uncultured Shewanella sp. TaxID=173975 RepID=UPI00261DC337|nr:cytochrome c peroxidase [uncultured Shewanella sp.]
MKQLKYSLLSYLVLLLAACGSGDDTSGSEPNSSDIGGSHSDTIQPSPDPIGDDETDPDLTSLTVPKQLIANAFSGTSIGLSWLSTGGNVTIYRDNKKIAETREHFYVDDNLTVDTRYRYSVSTGNVKNQHETANVVAKTLVNETNDGMINGAGTDILNDLLMNFPACNISSEKQTAVDVADSDLDACLGEMLTFNNMATQLEDLRAYAARVRREQSPNKVELGMRLFHNKSLSANGDTACSSCHHPAVGCGSDKLSMPIGLNAAVPDLLGVGRTDEVNSIPIVPRNSPAICNTSLWSQGLFWDNRVVLQDGELNTEFQDVTHNTLDTVGGNNTLTLLMAQAHFPVTAAPEMGDILDFGYDDTDQTQHTEYRENELVSQLDSESWQALFTAAFGDPSIHYSRVAESIAAYESVHLFIDNPFFDYVDGHYDAIDDDAKRGAITFMSNRSGCTFCHSGALFSNEEVSAGNYPQIGIGTDADGSGADIGAIGPLPSTDLSLAPNTVGFFRTPSLLNVAITGPWGHNGQFGSLKRNIEHYRDNAASIAQYFESEAMCKLEQFKTLAHCAELLAPKGLMHSMAIFNGNESFLQDINDAEVALMVKFLKTLTDPDAANTQSNAIQALIPVRDGGPDGHQLDAIDINGNAL